MKALMPAIVIVLLTASNVGIGLAFLDMSAMLSKSMQREKEAWEVTKKSTTEMAESFNSMKGNFYSMKWNFDECMTMLKQARN